MSNHYLPISVIIPCFRCRETVARALGSILNQTRLPAEILFVDDASGDGSLDLLFELAHEHEPRVRVITLDQNGGPGLARNAGWDSATQPWLAFLDADDTWHPRKLEIQWSWLESHLDAVLCGHASQLAAKAVDLEAEEMPEASRLSLISMLLSDRLPTRSVMLRRDLPFRFRNKRYSEDYLLWMEIIMAGYPAYRLESVLAFCFRPDFSPGGLSGRLWEHEKAELMALRTLREEYKLSWWVWGSATVWSFTKYLRRLWLTWRM